MKLINSKELDQNTYELTIKRRNKFFGISYQQTFIGLNDEWADNVTGKKANPFESFLLNRIYKTVRTKVVIESPHKKRKVKHKDLLKMVNRYKLHIVFERTHDEKEYWIITRPSSSNKPVNELKFAGNEIEDALMAYWVAFEARFQKDYE